MSNSDLVVTFIHKDLRLEDGLQIYPVDQVKMVFKSVRICKKENALSLATKQMPITVALRTNPLPLKCPT